MDQHSENYSHQNAYNKNILKYWKRIQWKHLLNKLINKLTNTNKEWEIINDLNHGNWDCTCSFHMYTYLLMPGNR